MNNIKENKNRDVGIEIIKKALINNTKKVETLVKQEPKLSTKGQK